jgi:hypothetical protein
MTYKPTPLALLITALKAIIHNTALRSIPAQQQLLLATFWRMARISTRFERLFSRWQSGLLPPPPRAPREAKPRTRKPPEVRAPYASGWLRIRLYRACTTSAAAAVNAYAFHIEALLATPEITEFRAAIPHADRLFRPLCHMLGITLPAAPTVTATPTRRADKRSAIRHPATRSAIADPTPLDPTSPAILSTA